MSPDFLVNAEDELLPPSPTTNPPKKTLTFGRIGWVCLILSCVFAFLLIPILFCLTFIIGILSSILGAIIDEDNVIAMGAVIAFGLLTIFLFLVVGMVEPTYF